MDLDKNYKIWITSLKDKILSAQLKAALSVNEQLIILYWDIGKSITQNQAEQQWGSKIIEQMAKDLKNELPTTNGFSRTNLFAMRKFYVFYKNAPFVHQAGGLITKQNLLCKIPWRHHVAILSKCTNIEEAEFYIKQTIQHNWSRSVLEVHLETKLITRLGKAINNFEITLPKPQSDLAKETLKDPYKFDFLTLERDVQELELEKHLTDNITKLLLELGKGFAFIGRQYPLQIGKKERKIDLLFYHTRMHCYVLVDLKMGEFEPEFAGKMNYYLSAVDALLKTEIDQPSIGIILCKSKDTLDVEYALRDIKKPLGISEFTFNELPEEVKNNMPTIAELENEIRKLQ